MLPPPSRWQKMRRTLRSWLTTWEMYPILLVASFLHFYQLGITEFDEDQATLFGMARDAVLHGLLPATSNIASIRIVNPPAAIYLLMIPAAISANPLGGAILVASLNVLAALLAYVFVRRYFGRVAGIVAALLFATASAPFGYSRFIWQPDMMAPFIVLFFFALFWGVVERRKGWLFPALLLFGILVQLHETMVFLAVPLLLAVLFAPKTISWRALASGLIALLVLFSPYIAYLFATHFKDIGILLGAPKQHAFFDPLGLTYYRDFFSPYKTLSIPSDPHTLIYQLLPVLVWLRRFMLLLVAGGFVTALVIIALGFSLLSGKGHAPGERDPVGETARQKASPWSRLAQWWSNLLPTPLACGLAILLVWQVVFLLVLSWHSPSVPLAFHYLLALMPGPFILVGVFIGSLAGWLGLQGQWWSYTRFALYLFMSLLLIAQFGGTTAGLLDQVNQSDQVIGNHHSLSSLQRAFNAADLLAQQQHLNHVYVTSDFYTQSALQYLAAQMRTPTTVFDESRCLVLPNPADGPAVLLAGPGDALTPALLARYGSVVAQPRQDVAPFRLYVVQPAQPSSTGGAALTFMHELHSLDGQFQLVTVHDGVFLTTWWSLLKAEPAAYRTTYTYIFSASLSGAPAQAVQSQCMFTAIRAGDELVVALPLHASAATPSSATIAAQFYSSQPRDLALGPIRLETIINDWVQHYTLHAPGGGQSLALVRNKQD
jgi:4-amino-4-deoxy-L-arabinose transferase-like glycosyltransferase